MLKSQVNLTGADRKERKGKDQDTETDTDTDMGERERGFRRTGVERGRR